MVLLRSFLSMLVLFGLVLSGCSSRKQQASEREITLEFWTLQLDTFKDTLLPMFAEYERAHPNIKIRWVDVPFSEGPKRTLTAMMSGHPPDVVNLNPDFSAVLASRNALVDMREALPEAVRQSYLPVAWDAATIRLANGREMTFGLPWYVTSSVTIYNKAILEKAGLKTPPVSFEELPEFAERVHEKTGAYGMMPIVAERGNFLKELKKLGISLYDERGRAIFATDMAIAYLSRYVEMYEMGWVPKEAITESHQAAVGRFQAGTLASLLIGPNFLKIVKENAPDIYKVTGVSPQFPRDARFKDLALMVVVVPRKSAHPVEAADFAAFITNAQNQLALAQAAPVLPSVTSALQEPYFSQAVADDLMAQGRSVSARQLLEATEAYRIRPNQNAINEIMDHYVQLALLGKLSAVDALKRAQAEINAILEAGA
jgi:putative chitobiose transport system substrate-binding protein